MVLTAQGQGIRTTSPLRGRRPRKLTGSAPAVLGSRPVIACTCTCGSVLFPELPHSPIRSPTLTVCPSTTRTRWRRRWHTATTTPSAPSMSTTLPASALQPRAARPRCPSAHPIDRNPGMRRDRVHRRAPPRRPRSAAPGAPDRSPGKRPGAPDARVWGVLRARSGHRSPAQSRSRARTRRRSFRGWAPDRPDCSGRPSHPGRGSRGRPQRQCFT